MFLNDLLIRQQNPAAPHSQVDTQMFTIKYNKTLSHIFSLLINTHDRKKKNIKTVSVCAYGEPNSQRSCIKEMLAPVNQFQISSKSFHDSISYNPVIGSLYSCTDLETQKTCGFIYRLTLPVHLLFRLLHTWLTTYQQLSKDKAHQSSKVSCAEK